MNFMLVYMYGLILLISVGIYGLLSKQTWAKILISLEILAFSTISLVALLILGSKSPENIALGETYIILLTVLDSSIMGIFVACIFLVLKKLKAEKPALLKKLKG
ncbi:MAG: hypothetical protein DRJ51_00165 [Thermoprotei archaeon]|nr:MAG: hypothetical protein DRJ36_04165 [Thermoprotei archaeon]RLE82902.1 MAG: hypothetical protein DRJ51_00165 [Thermoprotei archaeon]RLF01732.1 MAG: hypothetical protein DRJ59_05400 [Thermoprotei archaeon]